jgi:hypothetical protein
MSKWELNEHSIGLHKVILICLGNNVETVFFKVIQHYSTQESSQLREYAQN